MGMYIKVSNTITAYKQGGTSNDAGNAIIADTLGNTYHTGFFSSSASFDDTSLVQTSAGGTDIFVVKYNADGKVVWVKRAGGVGDDTGKTLALDSSERFLFVAGTFQNAASFDSTNITSAGDIDIFLAKFDTTTGNVMTVKRYGGTGTDDVTKIAIDSLNNVIISGYYQGTAQFDTLEGVAGGADIFLVKVNATTGNASWIKSAGDIDLDYGYSIALDKLDNIYMTGYFSLNATFGPSFSLLSQGSFDIFVAKYSSAGSLLWVKRAGSTGDDGAYSVAVDSLDNIYLTGYFSGTQVLNAIGSYDIFVAKYLANGNLHWVKKFGSLNDDAGNFIFVDMKNIIYVTGYFSGVIQFESTSIMPFQNSPASLLLHVKHVKLVPTRPIRWLLMMHLANRVKLVLIPQLWLPRHNPIACLVSLVPFHWLDQQLALSVYQAP